MTQDQYDKLRKDLDKVQALLAQLMRPDQYRFTRAITLADHIDISVGGTLGTRIGTSPVQKIGFLGADPIAQQPAISHPNLGATVDTQARAAIDSLINLVEAFGLTT